MTSATLEDLHQRLTEVENKLFTPGHFRGAEAECLGILADSYTKTDLQLQACTVILCIQAMFEQKKPAKQVDHVVMEQYGSLLKAPYQVFAVWFQYKVYHRDLRSACKYGIDYLAENKSKLDQWQYDEFIELLVFHCLTKLGKLKRALQFLKRNTRLSTPNKHKYLKRLTKMISEREGSGSGSGYGDVSVDMGPMSNDKSAGQTAAQTAAQSHNSHTTTTLNKQQTTQSHTTQSHTHASRNQPKETNDPEIKETKISPDNDISAKSSRWKRLVYIIRKVIKRVKEVAPVAFALVFVGVLLLLMKNAVSAVQFQHLKAEARKFLNLFFALDPLSR
mmetsp:Transcript_27310/g.48286  ORF Transcript_27310/g.48286 Transcript_27310/m.48286 type:complete len:334 (-) Transcript_27310:32-1033(-)|eukprot:CAMPEP_0197523814 /NCGR_PEP_ID=MMETSP1318-20131121/8669_1 /TAXON_ID=552666 /ORGANISM="Partenskyella glossopodia, Strain RCC365" /LENGTH=333 /DNA_ID=CAMNT_0043076619 /DNA_START=48 /DNA_END=1049 /DNA_ORIENTATION=+